MLKRRQKARTKTKPKVEPVEKEINQPDLVKKTKVKVVGIGDGASQIVSELARKLPRAEFVVANTDWRIAKRLPRNVKFLGFGEKQSHGLGTGLEPEIAKVAAWAEKDKMAKILDKTDLCFFVACLGGGTGSGATPVFSRLASQRGILSVGIFTLPFRFEGEKKMALAQEAFAKIKGHLNAALIFPNEKIFQVFDKNLSFNEGFAKVNQALVEDLGGLIELIFQPGLINIDFADLKTILDGRGQAAYLTSCEFEKGVKAEEIKKSIFQNPFLTYNFRQANSALFNIVSDHNLTLSEASEISSQIAGQVSPETRIIFGIRLVADSNLAGKIRVVLLTVGGRHRRRKKAFKAASAKVWRRKKKSKPQSQNKPDSQVNVKVRRNGLQIQQEVKAQEQTMAAQENLWETPAILRQGL
jgi:cell division protein FtsZ